MLPTIEHLPKPRTWLEHSLFTIVYLVPIIMLGGLLWNWSSDLKVSISELSHQINVLNDNAIVQKRSIDALTLMGNRLDVVSSRVDRQDHDIADAKTMESTISSQMFQMSQQLTKLDTWLDDLRNSIRKEKTR